ncbi:Vacuolar protein sorting-associated protein 62 [Tulasnella sp. 424]|nr:Vacuolar protein sorting-associated protein 62 [Tulasnella sp. 424]KAG8969942.1 Vacuolar protein sorting-associated protein 62 [Tulasnella sp. 425]
MTDTLNKAEEVAGKAVEKVIEPAIKEAPSITPSGDKSGVATVLGAAKAVEAAIQAQKAAGPTFEPLPAYALQYAPLLWLNKGEKYWPGSPLEHLSHCTLQHKNGDPVDVPKEILGKGASLALPAANDPDVYLTANVDPRKNANTEELMSTHGKPDPVTRRSVAPCWIILADKSKIVGPGVVDIFYFFFYPYNLGPAVVGTNFGNHVGDWEHSMIRFQDGKPTAIHLSAHSEGHSFTWAIMEKMGDRPVGYVATGSHANYSKPGDKLYTKATILGPIDRTNKGVLWDPTLTYVASKFDVPTATFTPLSAPPPTATTTAAPPTPGNAPASTSNPGAGSATPASTPVYDTTISPEDIVNVLNFQGKWGNSFNDIQEPKGGGIGDQLASIFGKKPNPNKKPFISLGQRLEMLQWTEGPTGPRYKSLDRVNMQWNNAPVSNKLI